MQAYEGVCIGRAGAGMNENFTVRKISYGEGVERVFPLYSPMIDSIKVVRRGQVRRAKLYYLRGRRGKSARIIERQDHSAQGEGGGRRQSGGVNVSAAARYSSSTVLKSAGSTISSTSQSSGIVEHLVLDARRLDPAASGPHHDGALPVELGLDPALEHIDHLEVDIVVMQLRHFLGAGRAGRSGSRAPAPSRRWHWRCRDRDTWHSGVARLRNLPRGGGWRRSSASAVALALAFTAGRARRLLGLERLTDPRGRFWLCFGLCVLAIGRLPDVADPTRLETGDRMPALFLERSRR